MYNYRQISDRLYYVGASDRRLALFENIYPIDQGVSYNSYLLLDDFKVLIDTVDASVEKVFLENLDALLGTDALDFIIVNHMEPDHASSLMRVAEKYPEANIIGSAGTLAMIGRFFDRDMTDRFVTVKDGDRLNFGSSEFTFAMTPMVHWPEVMMTFDITDGILFSADAFGAFGALSGAIYADEEVFRNTLTAEARRYYTNIVGKYGTQVNAALKKASALDIRMICPLHGPLWRTGIPHITGLYSTWASYRPEAQAVLIAYASVYGNTANAADILAARLNAKGVSDVTVIDVSGTDSSRILAEAFRCSHLVFASSTYNAGIFPKMENVLLDIKEHNLQNRTVAFIENGSWAPVSGKQMAALISEMKNMTILEESVTVKSSLKESQLEDIDRLADAIAASMTPVEEKLPAESAATAAKPAEGAASGDRKALYNLSYGLFVVTSASGDGRSGCIVNTVAQIADKPLKISVSVNKANYTHDIIAKSGVFAASVLTEQTPFDTFRNFGFRSGRDTDKFSDISGVEFSEDGIPYFTEHVNSVFFARVTESVDCGSHTLFIAEVTDMKVLSRETSATYAYYHANIKPAPKAEEKPVSGFRCKICGYVYEGDTLPEDFVCPLCKHGPEDFERI